MGYASRACLNNGRISRIDIAIDPSILYRSGFKTPSNAQWRRCRYLQNAHISLNMLRFFIKLRLALERDLKF